MNVVHYIPPKVKCARPKATLDVHTLVSKIMKLPCSCLNKKS